MKRPKRPKRPVKQKLAELKEELKREKEWRISANNQLLRLRDVLVELLGPFIY